MDTWILIADASTARLFRLEHGRKMKLIRELANPAGRARDQDLVSDKQGRLDKGLGRNVLSAMEPRTTPHEAEVERFALELANVLYHALEQKEFDSLALIAPPHFLGLLRQRLNPSVDKRVAYSLGKDYAHIAEHDLPSHLDATLEDIERAVRVQ